MPAYCERNRPVPQPMLGIHAKQLSNFDPSGLQSPTEGNPHTALSHHIGLAE
ncbi:hypothetical protein [Nostoc sp. MS1]|uniref:hypothetical protein n=1 Tax=Nostoc sp. MS1 TaxID=2764711 RepID=UPI001CC6CCB2|nr:hypothetical protein [Nostoc sp. MS1]